MKSQLKSFISACLIISFGIILAYHFFMFWTAGSVIIGESNTYLLILESVVSVGIIGYGAWLFREVEK